MTQYQDNREQVAIPTERTYFQPTKDHVRRLDILEEQLEKQRRVINELQRSIRKLNNEVRSAVAAFNGDRRNNG